MTKMKLKKDGFITSFLEGWRALVTLVKMQLKEKMMEVLPYYPICYRKMSLIGVNTFDADKLPMFNDIYRNCSTWSWSTVKEKNIE